ncbi:hypothetical protein SAMN05216481_105151 [Streptomyces radiopugnans]|uniref:Uncharacterized protein n=1 Tax=Streptomyces radiopugnans TaxID=403935 RepID=A0A1H9EJ90_9ACTN|nr:hypothetical protein SAMN05216481_105151 [Streptomyces radiopugnans]
MRSRPARRRGQGRAGVREVTGAAFFNPKEVGCAGQAPVMEERTE